MERSKNNQKLILKTAERIYSVNVQDIVRCESEKNYSTFYLLNGQQLLVSTTLKEYETILVPMGFFRSHQSHLINMLYFDHYLKGDNNTIVMKDKTAIPLAIRKKEEFLNLLKTLWNKFPWFINELPCNDIEYSFLKIVFVISFIFVRKSDFGTIRIINSNRQKWKK